MKASGRTRTTGGYTLGCIGLGGFDCEGCWRCRLDRSQLLKLLPFQIPCAHVLNHRRHVAVRRYSSCFAFEGSHQKGFFEVARMACQKAWEC